VHAGEVNKLKAEVVNVALGPAQSSRCSGSSAPLTDPAAHGGSAEDHSTSRSRPDPSTASPASRRRSAGTPGRIAQVWAELMHRLVPRCAYGEGLVPANVPVSMNKLWWWCLTLALGSQQNVGCNTSLLLYGESTCHRVWLGGRAES
jgi:hypothetical protein